MNKIKPSINAFTPMFRYSMVLFFIAMPMFLSAQKVEKPQSHEKREKDLLDKQEEQKQLEVKAKEQGKKRHEKMQTKNTQKRMKKSAKSAKKHNLKRGDNFFNRLFHRQ